MTRHWTHKLIVFTDIHLTEGDAPIIGLSPSDRFKTLLDQALERHADADAMILMGDLAHHGAPDAYRRLKAFLEPVPMSVIPMLGNHDNRDNFRAIFSEVPRTLGEFVHAATDFGEWRVLTLDTLDAPPYPKGHHSGRLCELRLDWLRREVALAKDRPILVATHHHPFITGLPGMDDINLKNGEDVIDILASHSRPHLICGHIHRTISGATRGVPWAMIKSPCHQAPLDLVSIDSSLSLDEPGGYGVVCLTPDGAIVHHEDLELSPVIREYASTSH